MSQSSVPRKVTIREDDFAAVKGRSFETWSEFVETVMESDHYLPGPDDEGSFYDSGVSTGGKVIAWLAIVLINSSVWGIIGILTGVTWVFGFIFTSAYLLGLLATLNKYKVSTTQYRSRSGSISFYVRKTVLDRMWFLVPLCVAALGAYIGNNVMLPTFVGDLDNHNGFDNDIDKQPEIPPPFLKNDTDFGVKQNETEDDMEEVEISMFRRFLNRDNQFMNTTEMGGGNVTNSTNSTIIDDNDDEWVWHNPESKDAAAEREQKYYDRDAKTEIINWIFVALPQFIAAIFCFMHSGSQVLTINMYVGFYVIIQTAARILRCPHFQYYDANKSEEVLLKPILHGCISGADAKLWDYGFFLQGAIVFFVCAFRFQVVEKMEYSPAGLWLMHISGAAFFLGSFSFFNVPDFYGEALESNHDLVRWVLFSLTYLVFYLALRLKGLRNHVWRLLICVGVAAGLTFWRFSMLVGYVAQNVLGLGETAVNLSILVTVAFCGSSLIGTVLQFSFPDKNDDEEEQREQGLLANRGNGP